MKVEQDAITSVANARIQGLTLSESAPIPSLLTTDAPFKNASESEEAVALRCKEDA